MLNDVCGAKFANQNQLAATCSQGRSDGGYIGIYILNYISVT